jgi:hypothetical protein
MRNTRRRQRAATTTRTTRKHDHKQRGGANWFVIPAPRKTEWATELGADFSLITGDGTGDNIQHVNQYLNVIRRQDELFGAALRIIGRKLGVDIGDASAILANAARIDASGKELFEYIIDVERIIQFVEDNNWSGPLPKDATKLQMMYVEPLSTLLLFPSRLKNLFILALANVIVDLSDPANPLIAQATANKATHPILADQFMSFAHSMSYTLSARDLRDGYFLNQAISEFQLEIKEFWGNFLEGLEQVMKHQDATAVIADKGGSCKTEMAGEDSWGLVAAKILRVHQLGRLADILTLFAECTGVTPHNDVNYTPPDSALDVVFDGKGTTLRKLYRNMDDTTLQFILQLTYTIQQLTEKDSDSTSNVTKEQTTQPSLPESGVSEAQTAQ